jgi:RNA polymerase sigma factor (sigma-70 family)
MPEASGRGPELVALARARLAAELVELAPLDFAALRVRLLKIEPETSVSRGALVHYVRQAVDGRDQAAAQTLFLSLTRRIEGLTRQWVRRTILSAGLALSPDEWREHASDLTQELILRLWGAVACGDDVAWELFFGRALTFAQGHVADSWLRKIRPRMSGRSIAPPVALSRLIVDAASDDSSPTPAGMMTSGDQFSVSELADLRDLVGRLPERERLAVVLRFWAAASEDAIAEALGGVTTRAVRYTLKSAYRRLRAWYDGAAPGTGEEPAHDG